MSDLIERLRLWSLDLTAEAMNEKDADNERLKAENAELRKDAERMQYLLRNYVTDATGDDGTMCLYFLCDFENFNDVRAALDAAMEGKK